jgi:hypothetical protein
MAQISTSEFTNLVLSANHGHCDGIPFDPRPPARFFVARRRRPVSERRQQDCAGCGIDTSFRTGIGHEYVVTDEVWAAAGMSPEGQLCLDCLETRLGREFAREDFERTPREVYASRHRASPPYSRQELINITPLMFWSEYELHRVPNGARKVVTVRSRDDLFFRAKAFGEEVGTPCEVSMTCLTGREFQRMPSCVRCNGKNATRSA